MKKKLKVGFIMGGGVSMGSFSAGALQYALSSLQENLNKNEFDSCEVDIFTGASAGSVTLTLAIFDRLNHENANYEYAEFNNWLKKLWTEEEWLDISTLATGIKKQKKVALFSDDVINRITEKLSNNVHGLDKNNKGILSDTIHLGMTMTNLNGIPRDLTNVLVRKDGISANPVDGKDALMNYASADYRYFKIETGNQSASVSIENRFNIVPLKSKDGWSKILETAVASGAFPGAFPSVKIIRSKEEYGRHWPYEGESSQTYTYSDGGAFNNDPIDHAMHMAGEIDKKDRLALLEKEADERVEIERLFIYIDPIVGEHPDRRKEDWINENVPYDFGQNTPTADIHKGFMKMVSAYMRVLMHQGSFKHLNKMDKVNNHLKWLEEMVGYIFRIIQFVPEGHSEIDDLSGEIKIKLKAIIQEKYEKTHGTNVVADDLNFEGYIEEQIRLIKDKYADILGENIEQRNKTTLMYYLIALMENISGLRNKQKINFIAIGADESRVLGDEYKAFKGFFNHQWRKYDYQEGKIRAFNVLKNVKVNGSGDLFKDLKQPPIYQINKKEEVITSNYNKKHFKGYVKDLIKVLRKPFNFKIRVVAWAFSRKLRKMVMGALSFERKEVKRDK